MEGNGCKKPCCGVGSCSLLVVRFKNREDPFCGVEENATEIKSQIFMEWRASLPQERVMC